MIIHHQTINKLNPNIMRTLFFALLIPVLICSCTVEKRLYNHGWHVEWKHRNNVVSHTPTTDTTLHSQETPEKTIPVTIVPTSIQIIDYEVSSGIRQEETTPELTEMIRTDLPENEVPVISSTVAEHRLLSTAKNEPQLDEGELKPSKSMKWEKLDDPIRSIWMINILYGIVLLLLLLIALATSNVIVEGIATIAFFSFPLILLTTIILSLVALKRKKQFPERYNEFTIRRAFIGGILLSLGAVVILFFISMFVILSEATSHG